MEGVMIHIVIGFVLFTPVGFLAAYLQDKHTKEKEEELRHRPPERE